MKCAVCSRQIAVVGDRIVCLAAADDWINDHETAEAAYKSRHWLDQPPTSKQLQYIPRPLG